MLEISPITHESEIDILRGRVSRSGDFVYGYGDERVCPDETLDFLRAHLHHAGSLYLLAREDDGFSGFSGMDTDWWEEGYAFLREIFVDGEHQRRGVAGALVERCIAHARAMGLAGIVTETAYENIPMRSLCTRYGFIEWDNPEWREGITLKKML